MQIQVSGHHVEVTESMSGAVNKQMQKLLKHYPDTDSIKVILAVEKSQQSAEAIVNYLGQELVAKATSDDLYQSINELKAKLEVLMQKRKATVKSHNVKERLIVDAEDDEAAA